MHDFQSYVNSVLCDGVVIFFKTMYNKTIVRFEFYNNQNNQGLGKGYLPQPSTWADNTYLDLDYSGYHKNLIH